MSGKKLIFALSISLFLFFTLSFSTAINAQICTDNDGDTYAVEGGDCGLIDCDDTDSNVHPGAAEVCDGKDTNCDGRQSFVDKDKDGDGVAWCSGDCDDNNPDIYPGATEQCNGIDDDCNGSPAADERDTDGDGALLCDAVPDCNDSDGTIYPSADEICADGKDNNCDGSIDEAGCICPDADADGHLLDICGGDDCDDSIPSAYPGAVEDCTDGIDNDCDGLIDRADGDAVNCPVCTDDDGDGYSTDGGPCGAVDCNDSDPNINPGAAEICDGVDTNCDGVQAYTDFDSDADGIAWCAGDCNDNNPAIHPGATEECDGLDNDCNGVIPSVEQDIDNDNFKLCDPVPDCNDFAASDHPGADEICGDGRDNNCNGEKDESGCVCPDADGDGQASSVCGGPDCDDSEPAIYLGAPEICTDGWDNDCDGIIDLADPDAVGCPECNDADGDGYAADGGACGPIDCNDSDPNVNPGAAEICDGADTNCDGVQTLTDVDSDADGIAWCAGDCDDSNPAVHPGAAEECDGLDNDCNGIQRADEHDSDNDGYRLCDAVPDCNDFNSSVNPGEVEVCDNGIDENCDGIDEACMPADIVVIEKAGWKDDDGGKLEVNATSSQNGVPVLIVYYGDNSYQMTFDAADDRYELSVTDVLYHATVEVTSSLGGSDSRNVTGDGTECEDTDNDGYGIGAACLAPDCDDSDPSINPTASDICENGIDENCNGEDDVCISSDIVYITEAEWEDDDGGELEVKATSSQDEIAELTVHYGGNSYIMNYDNYDNRHELEIDGVPYYTTVKVTSSLGSSASSGVDREGICGSGSMITIKKAEWEDEDGGELEVTVKRYYDESISLTLLYGGNSYAMEYRGNNEYKLEIEPVPFYSSLRVTSSTGNAATANVEIDH